MLTDVDALKPGAAVLRTPPVPLAGDAMLKGSGGALRRVVPYTMSAADARSYAMAAIRCASVVSFVSGRVPGQPLLDAEYTTASPCLWIVLPFNA